VESSFLVAISLFFSTSLFEILKSIHLVSIVELSYR